MSTLAPQFEAFLLTSVLQPLSECLAQRGVEVTAEEMVEWLGMAPAPTKQRAKRAPASAAQCASMVTKRGTGGQVQEQCTRKATDNSAYCTIHAKSNTNPKMKIVAEKPVAAKKPIITKPIQEAPKPVVVAPAVKTLPALKPLAVGAKVPTATPVVAPLRALRPLVPLTPLRPLAPLPSVAPLAPVQEEEPQPAEGAEGAEVEESPEDVDSQATEEMTEEIKEEEVEAEQPNEPEPEFEQEALPSIESVALTA